MKSTSGLEIFRRREMRDGFHNAEIDVKRVADQILAITGDGRGAYLNFVAADTVNLEKLTADDFNRISSVGIVIGVKDFTVFSRQYKFCCR